MSWSTASPTQIPQPCLQEGSGSDLGFQGGLCDPYYNCGIDRFVCSKSARTGAFDGFFQATCDPCSAPAPRESMAHDSPVGTAPVASDGPSAGRFERVSAGIGGQEANGGSITPSLSADGRFVAFDSAASNLVAGDANGRRDVFVADRSTGLTERISVSTAGTEGNADSVAGAISGDGRFVAFLSRATNLVAADTNGAPDVFVRDRQTGTTERVSLGTGGSEASGSSPYWGYVLYPTPVGHGSWPDLDYVNHTMDNSQVAISDDGRYVAFVSLASNLVPGDTNGLPDVFLRDRALGVTTRVNVSTSGQQLTRPVANGGWVIDDFQQSTLPHVALSGNGQVVAFTSAYAAVPGDVNERNDVYVRDLTTGVTSLVSMTSGGIQGNGFSGWPALSRDGRYVAFASDAPNLGGGRAVLVRDRTAGTTTAIGGGFAPAISADGHWVVSAYPFGVNLYHRDTGIGHHLTWIDASTNSNSPAFGAAISADGGTVAFGSAATNLTAGDTNGVDDIVVTRGSLVANGSFDEGATGWSLYATPDPSYLQWTVNDGVFEFYRQPPPPGTQNQAVAFRQTGAALPANAGLTAVFQLGNTGTTRKRISVLLHEGSFSDLHVCTFWLEPQSPLRTYRMRSHTTAPWADATISFYAATTGSNGGAYRLDNVALVASPSVPGTACVDPTTPPPAGTSTGANLLQNPFFIGGLAPWGVWGQIDWQVISNVFHFFRPAGTPAGVILQQTGNPVATGQTVGAYFQLGNSSSVRKRVTVLLHDADFSDLSACTFWLPPGLPLTGYAMRSYATEPWSSATLSVYPATVGTEQWIRFFSPQLILGSSAGTPVAGTECYEPATVSADVRVASTGMADVTLDTAAAGDERSRDARVFEADGFVPVAELGRGVWAATASPATRSILIFAEPIDLSGSIAARMSFRSWLSGGDLHAEVQVSLDGSTWETAAVVHPSDTWVPVEIDLDAYVGEVIYVRFVLDGASPTTPDAPGVWRVDLDSVGRGGSVRRAPAQPTVALTAGRR